MCVIRERFYAHPAQEFISILNDSTAHHFTIPVDRKLSSNMQAVYTENHLLGFQLQQHEK
jgi:hypothetical protein